MTDTEEEYDRFLASAPEDVRRKMELTREYQKMVSDEERTVRRSRRDRDDAPPGMTGGPGTNWENPPGARGGPGAGPEREHAHLPMAGRCPACQSNLGPYDIRISLISGRTAERHFSYTCKKCTYIIGFSHEDR